MTLTQYNLFTVPPVGRSIDETFQAFHQANPWVYTRLVEMARELVEVGHSRFGIGLLFEVMRWQQMRTTTDPSSGYKLSNNYRSRYARLIMASEPDLRGVFETRRLTA